MQTQIETQTSNAATEIASRTHSVYRFKYSPEFAEKLHAFAKDNEETDAKSFGELWCAWKETNAVSVEGEKQRLRDLGCKSDMDTKMFRSVRYYFRKKGTEKKTPTKRRVYVGLPKGALMEMDRHIETNVYGDNFTPAQGHAAFLTTFEVAVRECYEAMQKEELSDSEIAEKIKKTYKNRFFLLRTGHKGAHTREEEKEVVDNTEKAVAKTKESDAKKLAKNERDAEKEKKKQERQANAQMRKKVAAKKEQDAFVKALMRIKL